MLKLIETDSFNWESPDISVINLDNLDGLVKTAAHEEIREFISSIKPEQNKVFIHILSMGSGEYWGGNRNADYFPEENLKRYYKTFEDGHIFTHHRNKNPETAIGKIIKAVWNDRMKRVELIAWVDRTKGAEFVRRIDAGEFPSMSMACKTPYDKCSICGNQAHTRQEYCEHLTSQLGRVYADGRKVMALNVAPLKFFEQSFVIRGADPTSTVLQKVASAQSALVGGAEMAELEGVTEKTASHKKLSELIKEIEGTAVDYDASLDRILNKVKDPSYESIPHLASHRLPDVLATMAHLGISPSVGFLAELIGHKLSGTDASGIGSLIEGYVDSNGVSELIQGSKGFSEEAGPHPAVAQILSPFVKQASLLPIAVTERALLEGAWDEVMGVPKGNPSPSQVHVDPNFGPFAPATNVGSIGTGPHLEETAAQRFKRLMSSPESTKPDGLASMIKTLVLVGGAALAAKWYITNLIEQKSKEREMAKNNGIKIVLVKAASDYVATHRLAKAAMIKVLKNKA